MTTGVEGDAPVRWGILGTANIAKRRVIPALQSAANCVVLAIASRTPALAQQAAQELGIRCAYGSYDALLADPDIDAVYVPLPNHLHVPWTIRAANAGKHVLCEKPIALNADEARTLIEVRDRTGLQIGEAFMVRSHPRWAAVKALLATGRIGTLRAITAHFSYPAKDATNIRSRPEWGGGAMLDIGCYPVLIARWLYEAEPERVMATIERNPDTGVDAIASAILRFNAGTATFTCAGELVLHQQLQLFGAAGRIDVPIPFNPPETLPSRIVVDDGRDLEAGGADVIEIEVANQFTRQAEAFVDAVRGRGTLPMSLEESVANMAVLDALFRSAASGQWEQPWSPQGTGFVGSLESRVVG